MNKSSRSKRITRGSEKKKKEEEDLKKKTKIRNVVRTRLEEKNMRSLEELRLRSEGIGLSSIFDDDDDGSDTSMEILKDEMILHFKQKFRTNLLQHLGSNNLTGIACKSVDSLIQFCRRHVIVFFIMKKDKEYQRDIIADLIDDVIPDMKYELSSFMKETKLAAKKQEEVDKINNKRVSTTSKAKVSSSKPIFAERVGKGDVGKGNNEINFITLQIRFNLDKKNHPEMTILIHNKTTIYDLKKLIIQDKSYLSDAGEFHYIFGGKVMEENDTPLFDRGITKKNCLTVINKKKNDEMKETVEESNEDVDLDVPDNERGNVDVDSERSTTDFNQSNDESCGIDKNSKCNNEDDDDDEDPGK